MKNLEQYSNLNCSRGRVKIWENVLMNLNSYYQKGNNLVGT